MVGFAHLEAPSVGFGARLNMTASLVPEVPEEVTRWSHEQALHALLVRVTWSIDNGDWPLLATCLHPEAQFIRPGGMALQGREAIVDAYVQRDPDRFTRHVLSNIHLQWTAAQQVTAHSTVTLWSGQHSDAPTPSGRPAHSPLKLGEHLDNLTLHDGRWQLLRRQSQFVLYQ